MSSAVGTSSSLPRISADQDLSSNPEGPEISALQAGAVSGVERLQMIKAGKKPQAYQNGTKGKLLFTIITSLLKAGTSLDGLLSPVKWKRKNVNPSVIHWPKTNISPTKSYVYIFINLPCNDF